MIKILKYFEMYLLIRDRGVYLGWEFYHSKYNILVLVPAIYTQRKTIEYFQKNKTENIDIVNK